MMQTSSCTSKEHCPKRSTGIGMFDGFIDRLMLLNVMIHTPMYTIAIGASVWWGLIIYAFAFKNVAVGTFWILYSTYLILDPSPRRPSGWNLPKWLQSMARHYKPYKWFGKYFDTTLVKTKDLNPDEQYIFLHHPHGIISLSANITLGTNGCGFESLFPGIERHGVTLNATFLAPFFREWLLLQGYISADKKTLVQTLCDSKKSIVLVPGGAAEALHCHPGIFKLYLRNRKGFVRLAMETNKPLVPCIGFGENEIFDTHYVANASTNNTSTSTTVSTTSTSSSSSFLWWLQQKFVKIFTFSTPIITNPVPNPVKLTVVVGEPLYLDNTKSVDENHQLYLEHLTKLYNQHKKEAGHECTRIEII